MEGDRYGHNVVEMHPLKNPTDEQLHHYLGEAAFLEWVAENGGMTQEEATEERNRILRHIGMGVLRRA